MTRQTTIRGGADYAGLRRGPAALLFLVLVGLVVAGRSLAQQAPPMHETFTAQLQFCEVNLIAGRVVVTTLDPTRGFTTMHQSGNLHEQLTLNSDERSGPVSLDYVRTTPDQHLSIQVVRGRQVLIRNRRLKNDVQQRLFEFQQNELGPLTIRWQQNGESHERQAPTLWHLWLQEEAICRQELMPLLLLLRPGWRLEELPTAIRAALLRSVQTPPLDYQRIEQLVAELGADDYSIRASADHTLRELGPRALQILQTWESKTLDAEQRFRLGSILRSIHQQMRPEHPESPDSAAAWLTHDPHVWRILLASEELPLRQAAHERLQLLTGHTIEFNPEADAATRAEQLNRLDRE